MKILVVDDISRYRNEAENIFLSFGCNVVTAIDGEDAWDKIESAAKNEAKFDMIISDWQMPNIDGIGLLKKVKESNYKDIVFILLTTEPNAQAVRHAQELYKPDAVLGKPAEIHIGLFKVYVEASG